MSLQPLNDYSKSLLSGSSTGAKRSTGLQPLNSSSTQILGHSQPQSSVELPQPVQQPTFSQKASKFITSAKEKFEIVKPNIKLPSGLKLIFEKAKTRLEPIKEKISSKLEKPKALNQKLGPLAFKILGIPAQYSTIKDGKITTKEDVKPTVGKAVGGLIEDAMMALLTSGGVSIAGGRNILKEGLNLKQGFKTGTTFAGIHALVSTLKEEKIEFKDLLTSGGIGLLIGSFEPTVMVGGTDVGLAKNTLKEYGFKSKDYKNPKVLKTKFRKTVKNLHPDKGGNPEEFKLFMDSYNKMTSAGMSEQWKLADLFNWNEKLWNKQGKSSKVLYKEAQAKFQSFLKNILGKDAGSELAVGNYTPQQVLDKIIGSPLQNTPEGKILVKSAMEAKQQGQDIKIEEPKAIEPSVVQIKDTKTSEVEYKTIPKGQLKEFDKAIDDTKTGIAGKEIDGKTYHSTAKTPDQIKAKGAKFTGEAKISEIPKKVKTISEKQVKNIQSTKDVRTSIKKIKNEYSNLISEAEGKSALAQEQREGLNTADIGKLKRIYSVSKVFQEGDIETIRASKTGGLVNSVVENIQEKYDGMSEQEALDFALSFPTKADTKVKITPDIKSLRERNKALSKYLEILKIKQKELGTEKESALSKEWEDVLSAQNELAKIINVSRSQVPVGEGKVKVSRLEARIKQSLGELSEEQIKDMGLATFKEMNKKENIAKASEYVSENPEEALKVLEGKIDAPKGILRNSILIAMQNLDVKDLDIATRLASLQSTRAGQEISVLTEVNKNLPVNILSDIIRVRTQALEKRYAGKKTKSIIKGKVEKGKSMIKAKMNWSSILQEVRC